MTILETVRRNSIAEVTMNRPDFFNALSNELLDGLIETFGKLTADDSVRCIVLKGAGPAFMAGGDIKMFKESLDLPPADRAEKFAKDIMAIDPLVKTIATARQPVIAAVHGPAAGFGVSLAAMCDLVYASSEAYFMMAYVQIGTSPDGASTWFLPRIVGYRRAMELALLGDKFDAVTAERYGLVNDVFPADTFDDEVNRIAERLVQGPPLAHAQIKRLFNVSAVNSLDNQLTEEVDSFAEMSSSEDFVEGVSAFLEKRKPSFNGR
tara:strand:- start:1118 stop:1912 length:795 start_codon:yes stop_codon:yes gene_type:complete